jgi:diadenosine tetraphosphate (Ap4A) HIT family hydrolase
LIIKFSIFWNFRSKTCHQATRFFVDLLLNLSACISCDTDNVVSRATLLKQTELMHWWIDAKARPNYVITPVRHAERLSQLHDDELYALWADAARLLTEETGSCDAAPFLSLIVNHGRFRNLAHVHLKLRFAELEFEREVRARWTAERRQQVQRILALNEDPELRANLIGAD